MKFTIEYSHFGPCVPELRGKIPNPQHQTVEAPDVAAARVIAEQYKPQ